MDRPILFSGQMVRAILEGRKTQTRRMVKHELPPNLTEHFPYPNVQHGYLHFSQFADRDFPWWKYCIKCPYGKPVDRLWVRETFYDDICPRNDQDREGIYYRADGDPEFEDRTPIPWKPSIFMPRWASRITLEITEVRVQRLQEISFEDCLAEGIISTPAWNSEETAARFNATSGKGLDIQGLDEAAQQELAEMMIDCGWQDYARAAFITLWESINGAGSWDANPWVWCVSFQRASAEVKA